MTDPILQMYLLAFMLVAVWLILFWKYFRKLIQLKESPEPEKMLLSGMLVLFIGVFVTITNIIGIILGVIAFITFIKTFREQSSLYE
jgi:hypothetical protein